MTVFTPHDPHLPACKAPSPDGIYYCSQAPDHLNDHGVLILGREEPIWWAREEPADTLPRRAAQLCDYLARNHPGDSLYTTIIVMLRDLATVAMCQSDIASPERKAVQDAFCELDRESFTRFCVFVLSMTHTKGPYAALNAATLVYLKTKEAETRFGRRQEHP